MIAATDHQFRMGKRGLDNLERLNHQLKPLVGSPLAESQDALFRISAPGKVGIFRPAR